MPPAGLSGTTPVARVVDAQAVEGLASQASGHGRDDDRGTLVKPADEMEQQGPRRSGSSPRNHHARDVGERNRVRTGLGYQSTRQETASSSRKERRPREEQRTAPICVAWANRWPTAISTKPPCAQLTPSSAGEREENTGIPRRRNPERASRSRTAILRLHRSRSGASLENRLARRGRSPSADAAPAQSFRIDCSSRAAEHPVFAGLDEATPLPWAGRRLEAYRLAQ
jgi:hypothetical protein